MVTSATCLAGQTIVLIAQFQVGQRAGHVAARRNVEGATVQLTNSAAEVRR